MALRIFFVNTVRLPGGDSVTPGSTAPTANDDTATAVAGGSAITIHPLVNDTDPVGSGLTIVSASAISGTPVGIINAGEALSYTPMASAGTDEISYTIQDVNGQQDTGNIVVTVNEAAGSGNLTVEVIAGTPDSQLPMSGPAPYALNLRANVTAGTAVPAHRTLEDIYYRWTISRPLHPSTRVPVADQAGTEPSTYGKLTEWSSTWGFESNRIFYGPHIGRVFFPTPEDFASAGTDTLVYEVTVYAFDGTEDGETTFDVTVDDPNVYFTGADTIILPAGGDAATLAASVGATAGYQVATDAEDAKSKWAARGRGGRILFEGGVVHGNFGTISDAQKATRIGPCGTGRPILDNDNGINPTDRQEDTVIWGFDFQGTYDWETNSGGGGNPIDMAHGTHEMQRVAVHDCIGSRHNTFCNLPTHIAPFNSDGTRQVYAGRKRHVVMSDTKIDYWKNYGLLYVTDANSYSIVGCNTRQDPFIHGNGHNKNEDGPDHGPHRMAKLCPQGYGAVHKSEWTSLNGWNGGGNFQSTGHQACLRMNIDGVNDIECTISQHVSEGLFFNFGVGTHRGYNTQTYGPPNQPGFIRKHIGKCVNMSTANNHGVGWGDIGGAAWNMLLFMANVEDERERDWDNMGLPPEDKPSELPEAPEFWEEVLSSMMVSWIDTSTRNIYGAGNDPYFSNDWQSEANYKFDAVLYAPNFNSPSTPDFTFTSVPGWNYAYQGPFWLGENGGEPQWDDPRYDIPSDTVQIPIPGANAPEYDPGDKRALDFIDGRLRKDVAGSENVKGPVARDGLHPITP